jgi:nitrite reductase/ring-hydroxylating ferredoxin subunit
VASTDQCADTDRLTVTVNGESILLLRLSDGYVAVQNWCTHGESDLTCGTVHHGTIQCPAHKRRFNLHIGREVRSLWTTLLRREALAPLERYPVHLDGPRILLDVTPRPTT